MKLVNAKMDIGLTCPVTAETVKKSIPSLFSLNHPPPAAGANLDYFAKENSKRGNFPPSTCKATRFVKARACRAKVDSTKNPFQRGRIKKKNYYGKFLVKSV